MKKYKNMVDVQRQKLMQANPLWASYSLTKYYFIRLFQQKQVLVSYVAAF